MQAGVVSFALYLLHPVVEEGDLFLVFEVSVQEGIRSTNVLCCLLNQSCDKVPIPRCAMVRKLFCWVGQKSTLMSVRQSLQGESCRADW